MFFKQSKEYEQYVGKIFYSPYFDKLLKVERVKNDKRWYFRFYDENSKTFGMVLRAESPLSYFIEKGLMRDSLAKT